MRPPACLPTHLLPAMDARRQAWGSAPCRGRVRLRGSRTLRLTRLPPRPAPLAVDADGQISVLNGDKKMVSAIPTAAGIDYTN